MGSLMSLSRRVFIKMSVGFSAMLAFLGGQRLAAGDKEDRASPRAIAEASFAAFKKKDYQRFAEFFHPDECLRFQKFVVALVDEAAKNDEIKAALAAFKPYESHEALKEAKPADVLSAYMSNAIGGLEGIDEVLAEAKIQILGEIPEGKKVHVICRTTWPRPSPTTCIKDGDQWHIMLNDELVRMMSNLENRKKLNDLPLSVLSSPKLKAIDVIGHVPDGADTAQVYCRNTMTIEDVEIVVAGVYPVRKGDAAWDLLKGGDKKAIAKAMREYWE